MINDKDDIDDKITKQSTRLSTINNDDNNYKLKRRT